MDESDTGAEQSPQPAPSLRRTTFRGARLGFAGYALSNGIMFGVYLVLARLISPTQFGRYAAASVVVGVGTLFAEGGMMSAIIQRPDRVEEAASTAFYSLLVGGTLLTLAALGLAPVLGAFFGSLHVVGLAAALSGTMLLRALTIVPDALLQRRFSFARRVAVDPLGAAGFAIGSIIACANGAGAWGLVVGSYASQLVQVVAAWAFVRFRPRLRLASIRMWRELASFGRHVLGSEVLARAGSQLDTLMLGKFAGAAPLGQYRNGLRLAQQPANTFVSVAAYVLLPALARMAHDAARLASAAQRVLNLVAVAALPVSFAFLPLGEPAAVLLLGHQWRVAGHVITALFPIMWAGSTISACSEMFKAAGKPQILVRLWFVSLSTMVILMPVTAITLGAVGVAAGLSLSQLLTAAFALWRVSPLIDMGWATLRRTIAGPTVAGVVMALVMLGYGAAVDPLAHAPTLQWALTGLEVLIGAVVYPVVLLSVDRARRASALAFLRGRGPLLPNRNAPRRRRNVSAVTLIAVRPLFRYCYMRDAWVLRLVGERIGPVLRSRTEWVSERTEPHPTGTADRVSPPRPRFIRARAGWLAIAATLAAAALGFLAARTIGSHQSSVAPRVQAASGVFRVSLPAGWQRQAAEPAQRYGLSDTMTFAPAKSASGETLLLGRTATPAPGLLPPSVLSAVGPAASPVAVQLGGTTFYRYQGSAGADSLASVYALPTTVGTIVGVCVAPAASSGFTGRCEQLLGTLKLASGTHTLGPSPGYAAALSAAIKTLNAVRSKAGSQLSAARSATREASAATELAAAHADAASAIRRLSAGPASTANSALAAALRTTADAYAALARAASHGDVRGYNEARASLAHAAGGLKSAFAQLRGLGYSVG